MLFNLSVQFLQGMFNLRKFGWQIVFKIWPLNLQCQNANILMYFIYSSFGYRVFFVRYKFFKFYLYIIAFHILTNQKSAILTITVFIKFFKNNTYIIYPLTSYLQMHRVSKHTSSLFTILRRYVIINVFVILIYMILYHRIFILWLCASK